ncbi:MAG: HAMP domain-containing sensor histidine kinase [Clostridia bacterium]
MKNSNNKATSTLTFRLWIYFVSFAIGIFVILWFMQVIFLQSYYSTMKKAEVIKFIDQIESKFVQGDYRELVDSLAYKNVSNIFIFDTDGNKIYDSNSTISVKNFANEIPSRTINIDRQDAINKLLASPNQTINYTIKLDKFKSQLFVYGKIIPNTTICIVVVSSIDPIDATTSVLASQLVYVTIIALIISSIISIFLSKRLSKPMSKINEQVKKLAYGNYDVKFEKCGYTEIDNLADTLNNTTSKLAETDKIRKELIANVSHDLRTPLTMIKAYSEMIRDLSGENKEKREEHIKVIIDETDRLTRLVNDMMDLSNIESGNRKIDINSFDLCIVVKNIVNKFEIANEKLSKDKIFKLDIPSELIINADKIKIEQVLYNLISNAINHSGDNKSINIKISSLGKKGKIQIIDNGPGISKEDISNIWNRYYKVNKNFTRNEQGSGLGLSIVKNILESHNFKYGVESKVGKGSNFWFEVDKIK